MKEELSYEAFCPNTSHIDLHGTESIGNASFYVTVSPTEFGIEQGLNNTTNVVIHTAVTRYYEPQEYE